MWDTTHILTVLLRVKVVIICTKGLRTLQSWLYSILLVEEKVHLKYSKQIALLCKLTEEVIYLFTHLKDTDIIIITLLGKNIYQSLCYNFNTACTFQRYHKAILYVYKQKGEG